MLGAIRQRLLILYVYGPLKGVVASHGLTKGDAKAI